MSKSKLTKEEREEISDAVMFAGIVVAGLWKGRKRFRITHDAEVHEHSAWFQAFASVLRTQLRILSIVKSFGNDDVPLPPLEEVEVEISGPDDSISYLLRGFAADAPVLEELTPEEEAEDEPLRAEEAALQADEAEAYTIEAQRREAEMTAAHAAMEKALASEIPPED